ncbi:MAG: amidase, partial [Ilumatobacteraceae bacterium]
TPCHTGHATGASCGGSAAHAPSGAVPLGHANDGGGSIRIPAALNGLVGLKPSRGRLIDLPELDRLPVNLVTQGVVTRSVRDTAYYFAEAERVYRHPDLPSIGMVVRPERRRLRVGLVTESLAGSPLDPHTREAVLATGRTLEGLGHEVGEIDLGVGEQFGRDFLRYWALLSFMLQKAGGRFIGEGFDGSKTETLTKGLSAMFVQQAVKTPLSMRRLVRASREPEAAYASVDVVISPVVSHPAPPIGYLGPDVPVRDQLIRLLRFTAFTPLQNVSGSPAISLPLGQSPEGLPIGVQVAAPVGEERRLLSLALELEEAMPWAHTPVG